MWHIDNNISGRIGTLFQKASRSVHTGTVDIFSQPLSVPPPVSDAHPFQDSFHYRLQNDEQHDDEYHGHDILHSS